MATPSGEQRADVSGDALPISALQHYAYCPRQCALIHLEQTFEDNLFTMRGHEVHRRVDQPGSATEDGVVVERSLPVWSRRLDLIGKADLVEFRHDGPYPVEYKHGPRRPQHFDDIQLCAYALCLEEMTGKTVAEGAIYHASSRRRRVVSINDALRAETERTITEVRNLLTSTTMPPPVADSRCRACSLRNACLPELTPTQGRVQRALAELFRPISVTESTDVC